MAARASRTAGFRRMGAFSLKVGAAAGGGEGGGGGDGTARSATTAGGGAGVCDTGGGGDVRAAGDVATSVASSNENWVPGGGAGAGAGAVVGAFWVVRVAPGGQTNEMASGSAGGATPCSRIAGDASFTASAAVFNSGGRTNQVEAPSGCRTKTPASRSRSSIVSGAFGMPAN